MSLNVNIICQGVHHHQHFHKSTSDMLGGGAKTHCTLSKSINNVRLKHFGLKNGTRKKSPFGKVGKNPRFGEVGKQT
jgi:hypothetical protein